ncbi:MAG: hypothetical protein HPM95_19815 [Alphaproteobacteria bacterium]|nr:hypothetical protein [Alphaproteobacteria bacterium]
MTTHDGGLWQGLTVATTPMPGALRAAAWASSASGIALPSSPNKPEALFAREIVDHFGLDEMFTVVVGGDTCATRKPDPENAVSRLSGAWRGAGRRHSGRR